MHISSDLLGMTFDFFLFGLLVYRLYTVVKNHAVPFLHKMMRSIKKEQTELLDKEKLVTSTLSKIDNQRKQQQKMFGLLEQKVQMWHERETYDTAMAEDANLLRAQAIRERHDRQGKNFASIKAMQEVLPLMLEESREDLLRQAKKKSHDHLDRFVSLLETQAGNVHG